MAYGDVRRELPLEQVGKEAVETPVQTAFNRAEFQDKTSISKSGE